MNLDKVDRIIITQDQFNHIFKWVDEKNFDSFDLPLTEAFIIINNIDFTKELGTTADIGIYFNADRNTDNISITQFDMSDMKEMITGVFDNNFFITGEIDIKTNKKWLKLLGMEYMQNVCKTSILTVMNIFQYMVHHSETVTERKNTKTIHKAPKKSKGKNAKKRIVKLTRTYYTFDMTVANNDKRKYKRHTEGWMVRGFWRTYKKTGKRVWIEPFPKGDLKSVSGKEYRMT